MTEGVESITAEITSNNIGYSWVPVSGADGNNNPHTCIITVTDTSLDPTWTLSSDKNTINEAPDSVVFTLTTTNVPNGTTYGYAITGANITSDDFTTH